MEDFILLEKTYQNTITTLRKASYDEANKVYLTDLTDLVYDFDKIKEEYVKTINRNVSSNSIISFRSNDALFNKNDKLIFIEFKNGNVTSNLKKEEIRRTGLIVWACRSYGKKLCLGKCGCRCRKENKIFLTYRTTSLTTMKGGCI
ncbi:MAG: hypothetical protein ACTTH7_02105 [Treponema sp.]